MSVNSTIKLAKTDSNASSELSGCSTVAEAEPSADNAPTQADLSEAIRLCRESDGDWPLVFFARGKNRTSVEQDDLEKLRDGELLNDNLINFSLMQMLSRLELSNPTVAKRVYLFRTYFIATLRPEEGRVDYKKAISHTSKHQLFDYEFLFMPIQECNHWYLAFIHMTKGGGKKEPSAEADVPRRFARRYSVKSEISIITLDPLNLDHQNTREVLAEYFGAEARHRGVEVEISSSSAAQNVPQQNNDKDCGAFVLGYFQQILQDPESSTQKLYGEEALKWQIDPRIVRANVARTILAERSGSLPLKDHDEGIKSRTSSKAVQQITSETEEVDSAASDSESNASATSDSYRSSDVIVGFTVKDKRVYLKTKREDGGRGGLVDELTMQQENPEKLYSWWENHPSGKSRDELVPESVPYEAVEIIGYTQTDSGLNFLVHWQGSRPREPEADWHPYEAAREWAQQLVDPYCIEHGLLSPTSTGTKRRRVG